MLGSTYTNLLQPSQSWPYLFESSIILPSIKTPSLSTLRLDDFHPQRPPCKRHLLSPLIVNHWILGVLILPSIVESSV